MRKRYFGVFVAGIMAASLLAGCGNLQNSTAEASANGTSEASAAGSSAASQSSQQEAGSQAQTSANSVNGSNGQTQEPEAASSETLAVQGDSVGADSTAESNSEENNSAGSADESGTDSTSTGGDATSHILVLYYSASGNTGNIADMIAADTGADEFEITPSEPYTSDDLNYSDENSRVVREYNDTSLQDVAFDSYDVPNWDAYDTVFVGYPIWWQDASWVMKSFVKNVDFTGKTVIPFCTSSASGIGESGKNLEALAGTGNWQEGQRFSGHASEDEVRSWVESLGF